MRKLLVSILAISGASAFAVNNNLFQEFDNQMSIGFGMNQTTSTYGLQNHGGGDIVTTVNNINLEAERLLNSGVWFDVNANMAAGAGPVGHSPYLNPSDYGINGKVGYAFPLAGQHIQLTPYGMVGLNNNATSIMGQGISVANPQIANNFVYTAGFGGRLEYRINRAIQLYADQSVAYNWDQSGTQNEFYGVQNVQPQNNVLLTSTLGAKFNIVKNFQIGVKGFYNNYQNLATNYDASFAQPQNSFGGLVSVGLTY